MLDSPRMSEWDFVIPEEESRKIAPTKTTGGNTVVQFRPNRMALGCSSEMIQERISENAKRMRLSKLLKRTGLESDDEIPSGKGVLDESDNEFSKAKVVKSVAPSKKIIPSALPEKTLSKSQKKRNKRKQRLQQLNLISS